MTLKDDVKALEGNVRRIARLQDKLVEEVNEQARTIRKLNEDIHVLLKLVKNHKDKINPHNHIIGGATL